MSKLSISELKAFTKTYVDAAKQAGAWNATTQNFVGLLDKIGKIVSINQNYEDKLPELDSEDLNLGRTIEEYMIALTMPEDFGEGENCLAPALPAIEDVAYSYDLGRKVIKTTVPYGNIEKACLTSENASNILAQIMERLEQSASLYRYQIKKQAIGNFIDKAITAGRVEAIAKPVDTETGEAFIKQVKNDIEEASFASENTSLSGALIGSVPELTLYVNKQVLPSLQVDTLSGAFNKDELAVNCKIKVLDDFGTLGAGNEKTFAVLVDPRGIRVHNNYRAVRENLNGEGDFLNVFRHESDTVFLSKFTYVKAYKAN